eukprot:1156745-Pelagomonas_calceolata.AAC.10
MKALARQRVQIAPPPRIWELSRTHLQGVKKSSRSSRGAFEQFLKIVLGVLYLQAFKLRSNVHLVEAVLMFAALKHQGK